MRRCAKMRCEKDPAATVALRYADRTVVLRDLDPQHDPNNLDLCAEHANGLTAPVGWERLDERRVMLATDAGVRVEARSA